MQTKYNPKTVEDQGPLDRPMTFTRFPDMWGYEKSEIVASLSEMAETIRDTKAESKAELPWFKLATFGDQKSEKGCYRTNANTLGVDGVEADYDNGQPSSRPAGQGIGAFCGGRQRRTAPPPV